MAPICRRALASIVGALVVVLVTAAPAGAANENGGDPPGNNGTVKIDGVPFDAVPDNEPHPGCVFQVDFYGFDAGDLSAEVTFDAIQPTPGGTVSTDSVPIGEDSHAGGGSERGLDASRTYDLTGDLAGVAPQRNQGWHVRLTVHADGSQGADVKHKVFWVDDCATTTTPVLAADVAPSAGESATEGTAGAAAVEASTEAPSLPPAADVLGADLTASPAIASLPVQARAAAKPAEVLGESISRRPSSGPSLLARTGIGLGLAVLAIALIAGGMHLVRSGAPRALRQSA